MKISRKILKLDKILLKKCRSKDRISLNKHDHLTKAYNRNYFFNYIENKVNGTLINIKVMSIKFLNSNIGIKYGDEALKLIAKILMNMKTSSIVCRLSGSTFGVYIEQTDINYVKNIIEEMINKISNVNIGIETVKISTNISSVIYKNGDFDIKDAIAKLSISMSNSIKKGVNKFEIYNERHDLRINIETIERAILNEEITLYYQPKIDIKTKKINGVEALIRWFSKEYGYIEPSKIIQFAESSGYINTLWKWVMRKACEDINYINTNLDEEIQLSVNTSPYQLEHKDFLKDIKETLDETNFKRNLLTIEITESDDIENIDNIQKILGEMKDMGIKVSIDDFGKGYNSIDHIKNYNVDEIKIDKSLVKYLSDNPLFIKNLIDMIHTTNTLVVAEGVEEYFEYKLLKDMECDFIQGYYFHKPMEHEGLIKILNQEAI